jgi:hypothetical protein
MAHGSEDEAQVTASECGAAWGPRPGALGWLAAHVPKTQAKRS